jgi:hypothetical protein
MGLLSLCHLAITARWCGRRVSAFGTLIVQVTAPAPHTTGRLPAVGPDVPKLLAVMALHKASLSTIGLHTNGDVPRLDNLKISWDFAVLGRVIRNNGRVFFYAPSVGDRRVVVICLTLMISKPRFTSSSEMSSTGVLVGRCRMIAFTCFRSLGKRKVGKVVCGEVSLDGFKVIHPLGDDSGSVPGATEL